VFDHWSGRSRHRGRQVVDDPRLCGRGDAVDQGRSSENAQARKRVHEGRHRPWDGEASERRAAIREAAGRRCRQRPLRDRRDGVPDGQGRFRHQVSRRDDSRPWRGRARDEGRGANRRGHRRLRGGNRLDRGSTPRERGEA